MRGFFAPLRMTDVSWAAVSVRPRTIGKVRLRLFFQFGQDGGDELGDVADDAVVGDFEDRGFGVPVDGDDGFAFVHAGEVLDGAGDADGDVEFGLDGLAGLADLLGVGAPAGVNDGAGGSDGGTELVGEGFDVLGEAFGAANAATAGDDDICFSESDAGTALDGLAGNLEAWGRETEIDVELFGGFGARCSGIEDAGLDGDDGDGASGPSCRLDGVGDAREVSVSLGFGLLA